MNGTRALLGSLAHMAALSLLAGLISLRSVAQEIADGKAAEQSAEPNVSRYIGPRTTIVPLVAFPKHIKVPVKYAIVVVQCMVDPRGKPYEIEIVGSSGVDTFDSTALELVRAMTFEPGTFDNEPIDAAITPKIDFNSKGESTIRPKFKSRYEEAVKAIGARERATAEKELHKLTAITPFEGSFRAYAEFLYARTWGTEKEQLEHLNAAIGGTKVPSNQPKTSFDAALIQMFPLEVKTQDYGAALMTWKLLNWRQVNANTLAQYRPIATGIEALRLDSKPITFAGAMPTGTWRYQLFRSKFRIKVISGKVSQLKVYCERKYLQFQFDPALEYSIQDSYGDCSMIAYGDTGTTLEVIQ